MSWANLFWANLFNQVIKESRQVDKPVTRCEDLLANCMDLTIREFFLAVFYWAKRASRSVREVALVELQECHNLAQIELFVKIEVKGGTEVVDRIFWGINVVSICVIRKECHSVDVVFLKTLLKELAQEARVNWWKRLSAIMGQLL